jgi:hypothetical protein
MNNNRSDRLPVVRDFIQGGKGGGGLVNYLAGTGKGKSISAKASLAAA